MGEKRKETGKKEGDKRRRKKRRKTRVGREIEDAPWRRRRLNRVKTFSRPSILTQTSCQLPLSPPPHYHHHRVEKITTAASTNLDPHTTPHCLFITKMFAKRS